MKVILRLQNCETLFTSMLVSSINMALKYDFFQIMNHSDWFLHEENKQLEQHILSSLCSDSKTLSLLAVILFLAVGVLRFYQQRHAVTRGAQHSPVTTNIEE